MVVVFINLILEMVSLVYASIKTHHIVHFKEYDYNRSIIS